MKLDANKVREIFVDSLYKEDEVDKSNAILVDGITVKVGFNPVRLNSHNTEIIELLDELNDNFKQSVGGGYSFLSACYDKHGNLWGEHRNMEELFLLGMAINKVSYLLPREMWSALPGGVPYLVIKNQ
jgi:hypothetical protein